jgi:hypothetical protein
VLNLRSPAAEHAIRVLVYVGISIASGCAPTRSIYHRVDVPDAVYFRDACYANAGPPSVAYYPFHGIYVSINLNPLEVGLHLPAETTASFETDRVHINGSTAQGEVSIDAYLTAAPHGSLGSGIPKAFLGVPDPYRPNLGLGPYVGASHHNRYRWYLFQGLATRSPQRSAWVKSEVRNGTVTLPPIVINGHRYPAQAIPFVRMSSFEISPVNC